MQDTFADKGPPAGGIHPWRPWSACDNSSSSRSPGSLQGNQRAAYRCTMRPPCVSAWECRFCSRWPTPIQVCACNSSLARRARPKFVINSCTSPPFFLHQFMSTNQYVLTLTTQTVLQARLFIYFNVCSMWLLLCPQQASTPILHSSPPCTYVCQVPYQQQCTQYGPMQHLLHLWIITMSATLEIFQVYITNSLHCC